MTSRDPFGWLRGILVLWIVAGHMLLHESFRGIYDAGFARHEDFGLMGHLVLLRFTGVDLLFMLSGFLLAMRYHDVFTRQSTGRSIDRFYLKRLWRIYPLHVLMVAVIGLYAYFGVPHPIASGNQAVIFRHWEWTLALNLLLMNGWGIMPVASWNEPSWNLSIFFLLYVVFPNLLLTLKRLPQARWMYVLMIVLLTGSYALLRHAVDFGSQSDGAGAIVRGLVFFSVGILLALYERQDRSVFWARFSPWIVVSYAAMVLVWTYVLPFPLTFFHFAYPCLLLALWRGTRPLLSPRIGNWLGDRSFAIFLTHYPSLLLLRYALGDTLARWAADGSMARSGCYLLAAGWVLLVADLATRLDHRLHGKKS